MKRNSYKFKVEDVEQFKLKVYNWANSFDDCVLLDSNNGIHACNIKQYELIAGVGSVGKLEADAGTAFSQLDTYRLMEQDWMFGSLGYDLKNELEKLTSKNPDNIGLPDMFFIQPQHVVMLKANGEGEIQTVNDAKTILQHITDTPVNNTKESSNIFEVQYRFGRQEYLDVIHKIRQHIIDGDVYEMNFCMEFYAEHAQLNPLSTYLKLREVSPTPFGAFVKFEGRYILCASPERFIKKEKNRLTSQPIKGTAKRSEDAEEDILHKKQLLASEKERAENVMIVDVVRNDLARSSKAGSVRVDELFGIYGFKQVYQMISTISSELKRDKTWLDAIKNAYPMASMTGAPKIIAMQLIDRYEKTKRGHYSGAIGYITPQDDFDFNVVIRSIIYNAETEYLSYQVGGAITYDSVPEEEYEECLLKAQAIKRVLSSDEK